MKRILALSVAGLIGSLGGAAMANGIATHSYRRGPGWTVAQVKRMATKRRNQIKAKRAKR